MWTRLCCFTQRINAATVSARASQRSVLHCEVNLYIFHETKSCVHEWYIYKRRQSLACAITFELDNLQQLYLYVYVTVLTVEVNGIIRSAMEFWKKIFQYMLHFFLMLLWLKYTEVLSNNFSIVFCFCLQIQWLCLPAMLTWASLPRTSSTKAMVGLLIT